MKPRSPISISLNCWDSKEESWRQSYQQIPPPPPPPLPPSSPGRSSVLFPGSRTAPGWGRRSDCDCPRTEDSAQSHRGGSRGLALNISFIFQRETFFKHIQPVWALVECFSLISLHFWNIGSWNINLFEENYIFCIIFYLVFSFIAIFLNLVHQETGKFENLITMKLPVWSKYFYLLFRDYSLKED